MPQSWSTEPQRPVSLNGLRRASERVLSDLVGVPLVAARIVVTDSRTSMVGTASHQPLPAERLDREVGPSQDDTSEEEVAATFEWSGTNGGGDVAIWGGPSPAIVIEVFKNHASYVLGIATVIAAARDYGDGIGDAHVILGDRPPWTVPSPADQEQVLDYLREPPGRHATVAEAIEAVLAKTYVVRPMPPRPWPRLDKR